MKLRLYIFLLLFLPTLSKIYGQCGPSTPTFTVDLTGSPDSVWDSPFVVRNDNCCGTSNPDRCVKFVITLDPDAVGITFNIVEGAMPTGALFYQINCGPQTPVGDPICLDGVGPHILTFCKPGNNNNVYEISSIPAATGGTNVTINDGCVGQITASGFNSSTITWTSIYPGTQGQYNNYLSCTSNCSNPTVAAVGTPPAYVDYMVCGQPAAQCNFATTCDTVRAYFNPTLHVTIAPTNPTICFGQTATTITANGSGGTPPYSYLWNNINPSQTINVGVGTYNVQLSDASGCPPVYNSVTVTAFSVAISADAGADQTKCSQNPAATLNGTVAGATGGIWSGGSGTYSPSTTTLTNMVYTPTAADLAAGHVDLYLTTTGNGTCPPDVDTVRINYLPFTGTISSTSTNVSCFGGTNGTATVNVAGGSAPYTYSWNTSPAQTTQTASGLPIGTYSVNVTDAIGCVSQTTVTITQPAVLGVTSNVNNVACPGGSNASITATPSGGTATYTYSWAPGGQTGATATNLTAGVYTVTVTDANSCTTTGTYTITQPTTITTSVTPTPVSCFGGSNGGASVSVNGGTAPYTYSWSPGSQTSPTVTGLTAGAYTVTVTDAHSCVLTATTTITSPTQLTATATSTNETCDYLNNGTASVTGSGGTVPYTYLWQPGGQTTASISSLAAGTYTVTVKDTNNCTATAFATITQPTTLIASVGPVVNVNCFGGATGAATATASGGTSGYTYSWTPGPINNATASSLAAGTYTITVTDNNGCTATNSVIITQPAAALAVTGAVSNVLCNGGSSGSIASTATGGTTPYSYLWNPTSQTSATATNLSSGTYSLTVTDTKGCIATNTFTVTQPNTLSVSLTPSPANCFGTSTGSITATVSGGTTAYTYSWSPGVGSGSTYSNIAAGNYMVTVTDANNCTTTSSATVTEPAVLFASATATDETCDYLDNGLITTSVTGGNTPYNYSWLPGGQTTSGITSQASGTYTVQVTDNKGCVATATATIAQPSPIVISFVNQVNVSCFGGNDASIGATVSGGTPNYSYNWQPGTFNTTDIADLTAGTYTLTVTDANTCTAQNTVTITEPAQALSVTASSTPASCNGGADGTATAVGAGGTTPYASFTWETGALTGSNINGITAGTYTVTLTDNNGCTATNTVTVTEPAQMVLTTSTISSTCNSSNGSASVSVSGGTSPYTYSWSPSGSTSSTATNVAAGPHMVTVTDANGCTTSATANVNDLGGPNASIFSTTNVTCFGGSDGTATASVTGGTGTITYTWTPTGGNNPTATGLSAGVYTVTVSDQNGCISSASTSPPISQPPVITATVTPTAVKCFGGSSGTASVSAGGGSPGYTFTWLPGGTTGSTVSGLSVGTYTVNVTDTHNCSLQQTYTITQPAAALAVSVTSNPALCFGASNGSVSATGTGGTGPYNYLWSPGNIAGSSVSNLPAGTYTVTITDHKNCTSTNSVAITEPTLLTLTPSSVNSTCGSANGQTSVVASGGTTGYTYLWTPTGGSASSATGLSSGNYTVTVHDANGCVKSTNITVNNTAGPTVSVTAVTNVNCNGGSDGTATATPVGGTVPMNYSWSPGGSTSATATGLSIGIYTVTVTDNNGCQAQAASPQITQPSTITVNVVSSNVSCFGGSNGVAAAAASGGTPGYTYSWAPVSLSGSSVSGLSAGTYTVTATDTKNCTGSQTFTITQPIDAVSATTSTTSVSCFGGNNGTATVSTSGGTSPYSISWNPGGSPDATISGLTAGSYTANITDDNGCTTSTVATITQPVQALTATTTGDSTSCSGGANGSATVSVIGGTPTYAYLWTPSGINTATANGLQAGDYVVHVTDNNGCTTDASVSIGQPTVVSGGLVKTDPSCGLDNGVITAQISGGTSPYSYLWSPTPSVQSTLTGTGPGNYTVQVTDALGCVATFSITLTNIAGPSVAVSNTTLTSCFGGSDGTGTVSISQGTLPYSVSWAPIGGNNVSASGLSAGSYTVNVTDSLNCPASVTVTISEPPQVLISIDSLSSALCSGTATGTASVSASGGTPGYTYSWPAPVNSTSPSVSGLATGTYIVNAFDSHNCTNSISVTIDQPAALSGTVSGSTNPVCYGGGGSATVNFSGGTIPYSYNWSSTPAQTGSTADDLPAGTYMVVVTDANGCKDSITATITQPAQIMTLGGVNDTICIGSSATISSSASGGSGVFQYAWQPPGVLNTGTLNVNPTSNSSYIVIAYDNNGCQGVSDTIDVIVYDLNTNSVQAFGSSPICPGASSTIYAQATGNTGPLTYTWDNNLGNGPGAYQVTPFQSTTYIVTVSNSCSVSIQDSVTVLFNPQPTIIINPDTTQLCIPGSITFNDLSVSGNSTDPITSWLWSFGDGTTSTAESPSHSYTTVGNYNVSLTVSTDGGCTSNNAGSTIHITAYPVPTALFSIADNSLTLPYEALQCTNASSGFNNTYYWNFGDGNSSTDLNAQHLYSAVGNYTVQLTATNEYGCTSNYELPVTTTADFIFPNVFTPSTTGSNGGSYNYNDVHNDVFFPFTSGVTDYKLEIFNRWGELIFVSNDIKIGWDGYYRGVLCQQDVYVYKAFLKMNNGKTFHVTGDITLLQ